MKNGWISLKLRLISEDFAGIQVYGLTSRFDPQKALNVNLLSNPRSGFLSLLRSRQSLKLSCQ